MDEGSNPSCSTDRENKPLKISGLFFFLYVLFRINCFSYNNSEEFLSELNTIIESQLTSDLWEVALPLDLATSSFRSPSLFAYYASLNILNALGLFSKLQVKELLESGLRANKSALDRHHFFPKAWLMRNGVTEQRDYNQIANFALVE